MLAEPGFAALSGSVAATRPEAVLLPHEFWQEIRPAGSFDEAPACGFRDLYPAGLPDGRQLALPIRTLPDGGGERGIASLIVNQASFAVQDTLAESLARGLAEARADILVGLPTLGLTLAAATARALRHPRYVPLGTSRKFWYREELSVPLASVTSPGTGKRLWLDPRMLTLLEGRRFALIDDVVSTGASMRAALDLLRIAGLEPVALGAAMVQTERWRATLDGWAGRLAFVIRSPLLKRIPEGGWSADTIPA